MPMQANLCLILTSLEVLAVGFLLIACLQSVPIYRTFSDVRQRLFILGIPGAVLLAVLTLYFAAAQRGSAPHLQKLLHLALSLPRCGGVKSLPLLSFTLQATGQEPCLSLSLDHRMYVMPAVQHPGRAHTPKNRAGLVLQFRACIAWQLLRIFVKVLSMFGCQE